MSRSHSPKYQDWDWKPPSVCRIEALTQAFPQANFRATRRRKHMSKEVYHQAAVLKIYNRGGKHQT